MAGNQPDFSARTPDLWQFALNGASSEKEVVIAVRDFVAAWTPLEMSRLPVRARPEKIVDEEDINALAYTLCRVRLEFSGPVADQLLLERMVTFFAHAAQRLAQIHAARLIAPRRRVIATDV